MGIWLLTRRSGKLDDVLLESPYISPEFFRTYLPNPQNWYIFCNYSSLSHWSSRSKLRSLCISTGKTHRPPYQIFGRTTRGDLVGCEALRAHLPELQPGLQVVGHIHKARGACIHKWDPADNFAPPTIQNDDLVNLATSSTTNAVEQRVNRG